MSSKPESLDPSDRSLAESVMLDGDEQAFRTLYRRHTPRLYQFTLRILAGREQDAEDVVQETWIKATEKLDQFRWESSLGTWLMGIALNLCRALFRRQDERWLEMREDLALSINRPEGYEPIDLEDALTKLPSGYRTVLVLHDVEGFTHEEIGRRLEVSSNTSKSQLFHARRALRRMLTPLGSREART
ncbi:MAG: RNA polymerase sigma factor [Gemmatimonadota bacterium]|nr:MAG: RNA polymerase sigma factor [Gemmatimonadota bacterium]